MMGSGKSTGKDRDCMHLYASIISIFIVMCAVAISGCNLISGNNQAKEYHVGTKGLELEFLKGNPTEVYENDSMITSMVVRNIGTYSIPSISPARLIINYDEKYLSLMPKTSDSADPERIILQAKDRSEPLGGMEYYEFLFDIRPFTNTRESVETQISYTLCYPYQTVKAVPMCIDVQKNSINSVQKVCEPQTYTSSEGQGGPIAITKIIPTISVYAQGIRPQFDIYIENKGKGYVIKKDDQGSQKNDICNFYAMNYAKMTEWNKITVNATLAEEELECTPKELRLVNKESHFRCTVKDSNMAKYKAISSNYVSAVTVSLDYGYVESYSQKLKINTVQDLSVEQFPNIAAKCAAYEVAQGNTCISKCDYCASHPAEKICKEGLPTSIAANFTFENFSCACDKAKCQELDNAGNCIYQYCTGASYCCNTQLNR